MTHTFIHPRFAQGRRDPAAPAFTLARAADSLRASLIASKLVVIGWSLLRVLASARHGFDGEGYLAAAIAALVTLSLWRDLS